MKKGDDRDPKLALAFGLALVGLLVIAMIMGWLVASKLSPYHHIYESHKI